MTGPASPAKASNPEETPESCTAPPVLASDANELTAGSSRTHDFDLTAGQRISFRRTAGGSTPIG